MRKTIFIIMIASLLGLASCKSQDVPGRRRAPRNCNSCTKWSHVPQNLLKTTEPMLYEA